MKLLTLFTLPFVISCAHQTSDTFYEDCDVAMINLTSGIRVTDTLGYYSYEIPDSSWMPRRFLGENQNGLTVGDTSRGYWQIFSVTQSNYSGNWNWAEELEIINREFNVIEEGEIQLLGQARHFHIALLEDDDPKMISFYVSVLDTIDKHLYTLNFSTEFCEDYQDRICEIKPMLESFKLKKE